MTGDRSAGIVAIKCSLVLLSPAIPDLPVSIKAEVAEAKRADGGPVSEIKYADGDCAVSQGLGPYLYIALYACFACGFGCGILVYGQYLIIA